MTEKNYTLADGSVVIGPANPNEQEAAWLRSVGGMPKRGALEDSWKAVKSGLAEGALRAPFIGGDLFALGAAGLEKLVPGSTSEQNRKSMSDEVLQALDFNPYKPETTAGRFAGSVGNAVGGGLVLPLGGVKTALGTGINIGRAPGVTPAITSTIQRAVQTPVLQNAAIGAGAQLGGEVSSGFGKQEENGAMRLAGGAGTALLAALTARAATPKFAGAVHRSLEGTKPQDWKAAAAVNDDLTRAGATQQTVADVLPPTSQLRAVTQEMSNERGAGALYDKLAGRADGEVARLLDEAKTGAQRTALPNLPQVPGAANADELIFNATRRNRTNAMTNVLANGAPVPERTVRAIADQLALKANPGRGGSVTVDQMSNGPSDIKYLNEAANTVRNVPVYPLANMAPPGPFRGPATVTGGPAAPVAPPQAPMAGLPSPLTGLPPPPSQALVSAAEDSAGALTSPGMPPVATVQGMAPPRNTGFQMPGRPDITDVAPPQYANLQALSKYIKELEMLDSVKEGAAGQVIKNAGAVKASSTASQMLKQQSPDYVNAMDVYAKNSPQVDIARLLMENKLKAMPSRATASLPEEQTRAQIVEALAKLDPTQASMLTGKLGAADRLSMLTPQRGAEGMQTELKQTLTGAVAQPFTTVSRKAGLSSQLSSNEQLARLIANPTAKNMVILQKLGENNPDVARMIREISNVGAVNAATQGGQ